MYTENMVRRVVTNVVKHQLELFKNPPARED